MINLRGIGVDTWEGWLLSRTHFSLLTAPTSPQALCEEAVRLGLTHLVLTDTNALYGLYPFAKAARRVGLQAVWV
jgi:DNA polymerase III alpha subunit